MSRNVKLHYIISFGLAVALTLWLNIAYCDSLMPDTTSVPTLTDMREAKIGKQFYQNLLASGRVIDDPIAETYIQNIGQKLLGSADTNGKGFHFFILETDTINAFAAPGGYVGINTGLIKLTHNESELASVMAHEITHVTQGHVARTMEEMKKVRLSSMAGLLAAIALGTQNTNAAAGAISATMASTQQNILNFSRANENEADRIGMQVLFDAGYNPNSMPRFFERLLSNERQYGQTLEFLSTHPLTQDRIADAQSRADTFPKKKYTSSMQYYLVHARIRALSTSDPRETVNYFQKNLSSKHYLNHDAEEYGYGLALVSAGQSKKALDVFKELMQKDPEQPIYQIAYAEAALDDNNITLAVKTLKTAYEDYPDDYPVTVYYANTLVEAKRYNDAINVLNTHQLRYPEDPIPYGLLSDAQGKAGLLADAYQSRAQYLLENGSARMAADQIKMAMQLPDNSPTTKAKLAAQLQEIQMQIPHKS